VATHVDIRSLIRREAVWIGPISAMSSRHGNSDGKLWDAPAQRR
jgi:hypothetical protein